MQATQSRKCLHANGGAQSERATRWLKNDIRQSPAAAQLPKAQILARKIGRTKWAQLAFISDAAARRKAAPVLRLWVRPLGYQVDAPRACSR